VRNITNSNVRTSNQMSINIDRHSKDMIDGKYCINQSRSELIEQLSDPAGRGGGK